MKTFAVKKKRSSPAIRRLQPSRLGYHASELKARQAEIRRILRSTGAQPRPKTGATSAITPSLESRIHAMKSSGQPLPESTRNYFESRFGQNFGGVRIHSDSNAACLAGVVNAQAFTTGGNIAFAQGKYDPGTSSGKRLLAHELTHVVQQNGRTASFSTGQNSASFSISIQRKVKYISQVTGKEVEPFLSKFDNSVNKMASIIKGETGPLAADLHQALAILKDLRAKGKVTLWYTSGGLHYASYDHGTGEIRLHVTHGVKATLPSTLVHEAIHALHAVRFPRLAKMYAKVRAAGGTTSRNQAILLLKFKAWSEYWAYRKAALYYNIRVGPKFASDPHKSAMSERDVKVSIRRVTKETGKPFEPWKWNPPAKYKAVKSKRGRP